MLQVRSGVVIRSVDRSGARAMHGPHDNVDDSQICQQGWTYCCRNSGYVAALAPHDGNLSSL